jgi:hypothetical protein
MPDTEPYLGNRARHIVAKGAAARVSNYKTKRARHFSGYDIGTEIPTRNLFLEDECGACS